MNLLNGQLIVEIAQDEEVPRRRLRNRLAKRASRARQRQRFLRNDNETSSPSSASVSGRELRPAPHPRPPHGGVFEDYGGPYVSYPTTSTSARAERATDVTLIPHRTDELHSWGSSASDATLQDDLTGQHDIWTMDGFYNGTTDTCTSDRLDIEADNLQHKGETQSHFPLHCSPITGAVSEAPVTSMHSTSSDRSVEVPPTNLDVAAQDCFNGQPSNLLHIAVKNGTTGILLSLIQAGANVSAVDETGSTPLHVAVHFGRAAMVEILIYHGADVNARDAAGASPLETAVRGQHEELVRVLLSRNAILS